MFRITMLEADYGDALWVEYGPNPAKPFVVIVDCGFMDNYRQIIDRIVALDAGQLELLILTHVDEDHIKGALPLLADDRLKPAPTFDIWFNGYEHLVTGGADKLGAKQGEFFSALMLDRGFRWNADPAWAGGAVVVPPAPAKLPSGRLAGGLQWTLLSPTPGKLTEMRKRWDRDIKGLAGKDIAPGEHDKFLALYAETPALQPDRLGVIDVEKLNRKGFVEDKAEPNGSSIAVLLEYEGKSMLLTGDAHPLVLEESLDRLKAERNKRKIDVGVLKVSHHGSSGNTSSGLLDRIDCTRFMISTSGQKFEHPSPQALACIVKHRDDAKPVELRFNYDSDFTRPWKGLQREHKFKALYPQDQAAVLEL